MVRIGHPINGISINKLEYVLDDNGNEMRFADETAAMEFLRGQGYKEEDIENEGILFTDVPKAEGKFYLDKESCDFEDCTVETKAALLAAANAEFSEGRVLITKDNIEIDRELFIENDYINAYIGAWFDVDTRFGTQTHDTEDYVNVYANYYPKTEKLEVGYTLIKADGSDSDFIAVELADSERDAILEKLREVGLDECITEMQSDPDESEGLTMT
jgi:hypothetical protein